MAPMGVAQADPGRRFGSALSIALFLLVLLFCAAFEFHIRNGISTDWDEGVYVLSLRSMASGHALYTAVFSSQPPFFLQSVFPLSHLLGDTLPGDRLGLIPYAFLALTAMFAAGWSLAGRWAGLAAAALTAVNPWFLYEAHEVEAELPSMTWECVAVAAAILAIRWEGKVRAAALVISGLAVGLGMQTKLSAIVAAVPVAVVILIGPGQRLRSLLLTAAGGAAGLVAPMVPYLFDLPLVFRQVVQYHLDNPKATDFAGGVLYNIGILFGTVRAGRGSIAVSDWHPVALLAGAGAVAAALARSRAILPGLAWCAATVLFFLYQQPLFDHHTSIFVPALALTAAVGLAAISRLVGSALAAARVRSLLAGPLAAAALATVVVGVTGIRSLQMTPWLRSPWDGVALIAHAVAARTSPDRLIVTDNLLVAILAQRDTPPDLVDVSLMRMRSSSLTLADLERQASSCDVQGVLFDTGGLSRFDVGRPAFRPWVAEHFPVLVRLPGGRLLFMRSGPC